MTFTTEPTKTPTEIGAIVVVLKDTFDEDGDPFQSAHYDVRIEMSDGPTVKRRGDLAPHITPAQRAALMSFMSTLRTQAEDEFLP